MTNVQTDRQLNRLAEKYTDRQLDVQSIILNGKLLDSLKDNIFE